MSERIYPQMLSGEISGYFSFKYMAFYNMHLLFFTLLEKKLIIYWAPTMLHMMPGCYSSEISKE